MSIRSRCGGPVKQCQHANWLSFTLFLSFNVKIFIFDFPGHVLSQICLVSELSGKISNRVSFGGFRMTVKFIVKGCFSFGLAYACFSVYCNDCMFLSAFDGYTEFPRSVLVGHASLGSDCTFSVFYPLAPVALFFPCV